jgi:hypothetical protein
MLVRSLDRCRHDAGRCECRSRPDIGRGMISIYGSIVLLYSLRQPSNTIAFTSAAEHGKRGPTYAIDVELLPRRNREPHITWTSTLGVTTVEDAAETHPRRGSRCVSRVISGLGPRDLSGVPHW